MRSVGFVGAVGLCVNNANLCVLLVPMVQEAGGFSALFVRNQKLFRRNSLSDNQLNWIILIYVNVKVSYCNSFAFRQCSMIQAKTVVEHGRV